MINRHDLVTADLNERIMVDSEPDFGDMDAIDLFLPGNMGRDVACNVSTIDLPPELES